MKKLLLVIMALATLMYVCAYADDTAATPTDLECEHIHAQWKTVYDWDNAVYQQESSSVNHTVFLTVTEIYHCDDCNQDVITNVFENFQKSQHHHFVNDVCTECGYVNHCTHETKFLTYFFYDYNEVTYTPIDNKDHIVSGKGFPCWRCFDCAEMWPIEIDSEIYTFTNPHSYNEDGICGFCGHINTCTHENTEDIIAVNDYYGIASITENGHSFYGGYYSIVTRCADCWTILNVNDYPNGDTVFAHTYDENGICTVCGYTKLQDEPDNQETGEPVQEQPQNKPSNQAADNSVKEPKTISLLTVEEYDEATGQVMKTLEDCVNTKNLSEVLPEEVCEKLNKAGSMLITPQAATFENIPDNEETVTVIFKSEEDQEAGQDVVVLLGTIQEEEWKWYAYEGKTQEDNTISFTIPREELTAFGNSPIILSVLAAEQTPEQ